MRGLSSKSGLAPLLSLLPLLLLGGCVDEALGPRVPIRVGGTPDFARTPDRGLEDAAPTDAAPPPDMRVPSVPSSGRQVWFIQRHDPVNTGLRAALSPPQTPAPLDDLVAPVWVVWAGPDSPGTAALTRRLQAGLPTAALYHLADRTADAPADVSWLAARILSHPAALRLDGRPVLAVAPGPDRAGLDALRRRLADLDIDAFMIIEVDVDDRPWPAADGVFPRARYGALDGTDQAAARLRAGRAAALAAGWQWLARVGPAPNRRLDDAQAPVPSADALTRSLILGRRGAQPEQPILLVDALGGWRDDRQVDPVDGETTATPIELTDARPQVAYGQGRLKAIEDHLLTVQPQPPDRLEDPLVLLSWQGLEVPNAERVDNGITCTGGPAEWAITARPFVLPSDAILQYVRDGGAQVDLRFADGTRLHERVPPPDGEIVRVRLAGFAGQIVEAVLLEATRAGRIEGLRLE